MKKIMLAAVAASFVSTGASAVQLPAEGEACSSIHSNISVGINNPELSDYRKCVMIQHEIDTAFTYKTFWVRTGTEFTSFPVETLAKMNRGERIDYIKLAIQRGVAIEALTAERNALIIRRDELINALTEKGNHLNMVLLELADANKMIVSLTTALEAAGRPDSVVRLEAFEEGRVAGIASVTPEDGHHSTVYRDNLGNVTIVGANAQSFRIEDGINQSHVDAARREGINSVDITVDNEAVRTQADSAGRAAGARVYLDNIQVGEDKHDEFKTGDFTNAGPKFKTPQEKVGRLTSTQESAIKTSEELTVSSFFGNTTTYISIEVDGKTYSLPSVYDHGGDGTISVSDALSDSIDAFIDGFDAGYSRGYDDGFSDGYKKGYTDGFADGVASARG